MAVSSKSARTNRSSKKKACTATCLKNRGRSKNASATKDVAQSYATLKFLPSGVRIQVGVVLHLHEKGNRHGKVSVLQPGNGLHAQGNAAALKRPEGIIFGALDIAHTTFVVVMQFGGFPGTTPTRIKLQAFHPPARINLIQHL